MPFEYALTYAREWARFWSSNSTYSTALTAIGSKADVLSTVVTDPASTMLALSSASTGRAIVPVGPGSLVGAKFYGTDTDNDTFSVRVWGWRSIGGSSTVVQWTPSAICDLAVTLGAKTGIASGLVLNTDLYADGITISPDGGLLPNQTRTFGEGVANSPLEVWIDPLGCEFVEFECTNSGGSAVSFNGLFTACNGG